MLNAEVIKKVIVFQSIRLCCVQCVVWILTSCLCLLSVFGDKIAVFYLGCKIFLSRTQLMAQRLSDFHLL